MPAARIADYDTWQAGYGQATVRVFKAGTNNLASIFEDEALTIAVANPQILLEKTEGTISYGKFSKPIYVGEPYQLSINSVDTTGAQRIPITSLSGEDASGATAKAKTGTVAHALEDHLARRIDVRDHGVFLTAGNVGVSEATNSATLAAAIGVAGAAGGGYVELPAGTYPINAITLPAGVVVRGQGRGATTLKSTLAGNVATIGGNRAGFSKITLDGSSLTALSVGVYSKAKDQTIFDDCEIKRFETGHRANGGKGSMWKDFYVSDCVDGVVLRGDKDAGAGNNGAAFTFASWRGGAVSLCSGSGVVLEYIDEDCGQIAFQSVGFETNTGNGAKVVGARGVRFRDCWWNGNTTNLDVNDKTPIDVNNTVIDLRLSGGYMKGGNLKLAGNLEDVVLEQVALLDVDATLTTPKHNVLVLDCREDDDTTVSGTATAWQRRKSTSLGSAFGLTSGNAATKAWSKALVAGEIVHLEAKVIGRQRNGANYGFYHIAVAARRPGATLPYDTQTANFTVGNVLTGQTSKAKGRIISDSDSGTTGTLTLQDVEGTFVDNELITDGAGGSATANGTTANSNVALVGSVVSLETAQETDTSWNANFVANGPEIELQVTGATGQTIEWSTQVDVTGT